MITLFFKIAQLVAHVPGLNKVFKVRKAGWQPFKTGQEISGSVLNAVNITNIIGSNVNNSPNTENDNRQNLKRIVFSFFIPICFFCISVTSIITSSIFKVYQSDQRYNNQQDDGLRGRIAHFIVLKPIFYKSGEQSLL